MAQRFGDLFMRNFEILKFRMIKQNYTQWSGKFEKSDDDLTHLTSAYEVATFLKRNGCQFVFSREPKRGLGLKNFLKNIIRKMSILQYYDSGIYLIFQKTYWSSPNSLHLKQTRFVKRSPDNILVSLNSSHAFLGLMFELFKFSTAEIGHTPNLWRSPKIFLRIKLRSISRKSLHNHKMDMKHFTSPRRYEMFAYGINQARDNLDKILFL